MRQIGKRFYLLLAILILSLPLQATAAEPDGESSQNGVGLKDAGNGRVSVTLEESIGGMVTAVSVSLEVEIEGGEATVDFEFSPQTESLETVKVTKENGGLDIYVVKPYTYRSAENGFQSLLNMDGKELNLGSVKITPQDPSQTLTAKVSAQKVEVVDGSISKDVLQLQPEEEPPALGSIEVGGSGGSDDPAPDTPGPDNPGTPSPDTPNPSDPDNPDTPNPPDPDNPDTPNPSDPDIPDAALNPDNGQGSGDNGGGSGSGSGDSNIDQGLYDENTQFVNDPSDAQTIPAPIIKDINQPPEMVDLSKNPLEEIAGKRSPGSGASAGQVKEDGKVSVISPEDGPASILISKGGDKDDRGAEGEGEEGEILLGKEGNEENTLEAGEEGAFAEGAMDDTEEIRLDQANGGVSVSRKTSGSGWLAAVVGIVAAVIAAAGVALIIIKKRQQYEEDDEE